MRLKVNSYWLTELAHSSPQHRALIVVLVIILGAVGLGVALAILAGLAHLLDFVARHMRVFLWALGLSGFGLVGAAYTFQELSYAVFGVLVLLLFTFLACFAWLDS